MNMDAVLRIKADVQGENNIRRLGNSLQGLQGQVKNASMSFSMLKASVAGIGAAIAGSAAVGGLTAVVKSAINVGDELFNLQAKTGIGAQALTGIGNAAKLADVNLATLGKGLTKLNINLVKAAEGNKELGDKFKALGVNVKDANGNVAPADQVLKQVADRFADMPDGAQKAAAAVALFGKAGADLIPLLNEGAASMEKFTYKVSEDFAARSDLFNDTLTEFGIKTQGFGLELTDALLPALQSIIEVFGDLFDTKQDWTALFDVIVGGIRVIATVAFATIKLVDQLTKVAVYSFDAIGKALSGDFAGAGRALQQGFGAGIEQAKRDFDQIRKIWTDAPSPGTGRRSGGRSMPVVDREAERQADRAAARQQLDAQREIEKAQRDYNDALEESGNLAQTLRDNIDEINAETLRVGESPIEAINNDFNDAIRAIDIKGRELVEKIRELRAKTGNTLMFEGLANSAGTGLAQQYLNALGMQAERQRSQAFSDLFDTEEASQFQNDIWGFFGGGQQGGGAFAGLRDGLNGYIEQIGTMREAMSQLASQGIQGVEDAIVSLVTTGKANFKDFARSIIQATIKMIVQQLILKTIMQALGFGTNSSVGAFSSPGSAALSFDPSGFGFARGGVFAANGIQPFARGGVFDSPTLFKFASGGVLRTGMLGEAGPEAIMPLRRGRDGSLGVAGGGGTTNVNVNVDASGSQVSGNGGEGAALGRAIAGAVQQELLRQKRPGGLLAA